MCTNLLWGFEFISSDRVKVFDTNLNKITTIKEYYYDVDLELSYINIFQVKITLEIEFILLNLIL